MEKKSLFGRCGGLYFSRVNSLQLKTLKMFVFRGNISHLSFIWGVTGGPVSTIDIPLSRARTAEGRRGIHRRVSSYSLFSLSSYWFSILIIFTYSFHQGLCEILVPSSQILKIPPTLWAQHKRVGSINNQLHQQISRISGELGPSEWQQVLPSYLLWTLKVISGNFVSFSWVRNTVSTNIPGLFIIGQIHTQTLLVFKLRPGMNTWSSSV